MSEEAKVTEVDYLKAKNICNDPRHNIPALQMRWTPKSCDQCIKIASGIAQARQEGIEQGRREKEAG